MKREKIYDKKDVEKLLIKFYKEINFTITCSKVEVSYHNLNKWIKENL